MIRKWILTGAGLLWIMAGTGTGRLLAAPQDAQQKPAYTLAEYNAYKAADAEQNPQQRIKLLDDFVKQYPASTLLPYIYRAYYLTNYALKNYAGTLEYADRQIALGDKIDAQTKARDAAGQGLKTLDEWKKPEAMAQDAYDQTKKGYTVLFNTIAAMTSMSLKDYPSAATSYKAVLATDPNDAVSHFRLGVVYLQMTPPQGTDGFWELARSIALKAPNAAQVQTYLKNQLIRYQQPACDQLVTDQITELVTLAGGSPDRPATLNIPSAAELQKARDDTGNFLPALKAGGDPGKVMWLASCGLEYPDVGVRLMETPAVEGDNVNLKVFRGATPEEIEAATGPNMEVKIIAEDLQEEKAAPTKKGPGKKAPAKKAPAD